MYFADVVSVNKVFTESGLFNAILPAHYYVMLYSTLYIISPYLNLVIERFNKKQLKKFLIIMGSLFSVEPFIVDCLGATVKEIEINSLNTVSSYGSLGGYSIVNFVLLYYIGAYIKRYEVSLRKCELLSIAMVMIVCNYILSLIPQLTWIMWNYNNPILIIFVVCVFIFFLKIEIYNSVINELSKATFTCLVFHGYFITKLDYAKYVNENICILIAHQIITAVLFFFISYLAYRIFDFLFKPITYILKPLCNKIDFLINIKN